MYLKHCIQTLEFSEFLAGIDLACNMEYNGSKLYKYIELLVSVCLTVLFSNAVFIYYREKHVSILTRKPQSWCDLTLSLLIMIAPTL